MEETTVVQSQGPNLGQRSAVNDKHDTCNVTEESFPPFIVSKVHSPVVRKHLTILNEADDNITAGHGTQRGDTDIRATAREPK